jgi:hypothetical protein
MQELHISESEAAKDLPALIARVRRGDRVVIRAGDSEVALVDAAHGQPEPKTLSRAIRLAREHALPILLDDEFSRDLEEIIAEHALESCRDPWTE